MHILTFYFIFVSIYGTMYYLQDVTMVRLLLINIMSFVNKIRALFSIIWYRCTTMMVLSLIL